MTLNDANEIVKILQSINENSLFAIGGRQSLISQNILKAYRPINDIDLNVIIPPGRPFPLSNISDCFSAIRNRLRSYYKEFNCSVAIGDLGIAYNEGEEEVEVGGEMGDFFDPPIVHNCNDVFVSVVIKIVPKPPTPTVIPQNGLKFVASFDDQSWQLPGGWPTYTTTITTAGSIVSGTDDLTSSSSYTPPAYEVIGDDIYLEDNMNSIIRLGELVLNNSGEIKIDLFPLYATFPTNKLKIIDDQFYVAPYVILKAKQKYCRNPRTRIDEFNKHLCDLYESFKSTPIKGLNYPEDIKNLHEARTIMAEAITTKKQ